MIDVGVFGDSHVRCFLDDAEANAIYGSPDTFFKVSHAGLTLGIMKLGSSGATARGLPNEHSDSGAGETLVLHTDRPRAMVLVLGEVDVRAHAAIAPDPVASARESLRRYEAFLRDRIIPRLRGPLALANCPAHAASAHVSMFQNDRGKGLALAEAVFNDGIADMCERLGARLLDYRTISAGASGRLLLPEDRLVPDGTDCHVFPASIRDALRDAAVAATLSA